MCWLSFTTRPKGLACAVDPICTPATTFREPPKDVVLSVGLLSATALRRKAGRPLKYGMRPAGSHHREATKHPMDLGDVDAANGHLSAARAFYMSNWTTTRWSTSICSRPCRSALDANPQAMRQPRETVEHPFGTIKARKGATHFVTKAVPKVAAEMALAVLAYNLTCVMNTVGTNPLMAALAG
jgi:hypothetical protein